MRENTPTYRRLTATQRKRLERLRVAKAMVERYGVPVVLSGQDPYELHHEQTRRMLKA